MSILWIGWLSEQELKKRERICSFFCPIRATEKSCQTILEKRKEYLNNDLHNSLTKQCHHWVERERIPSQVCLSPRTILEEVWHRKTRFLPAGEGKQSKTIISLGYSAIWKLVPGGIIKDQPCKRDKNQSMFIKEQRFNRDWIKLSCHELLSIFKTQRN